MWEDPEEENLIKQTREEVDEFVERIRFERGTDMTLAFASSEEIKRRSESVGQIAEQALRRYQELINHVNSPFFLGRRAATLERLHKEIQRITEAMNGN